MYKKFVVFCDGIIVTQLYEFKKKTEISMKDIIVYSIGRSTDCLK